METRKVFETLQLAVGPVIPISTCGLILLGITNCLGRAIDRARQLHFLRVALVLASLPTLPGCSVAAYGLGVATMVNDMKVREQEDYERYRKKEEAANAVRARDGLPERDVMSFRQWVRQTAR